MLTKVECVIALSNLSMASFFYVKGNEELVEETRAYTNTLNELIRDHFDKSKNSADFNNFKLHADSTLKTFKKDELIDYIHILYHNWQGSDLTYNNVVKSNFQLLDEINELKSNPPLKFEELKEGMWVWDNKYKHYIKIRRVKKGRCFVGYYPNFEVNPETDELCENLQSVFFYEENRLYRKQKEEYD